MRVNITDPDSHMMKSQTGWVQGYNAQAAVDEGGVVLSARVTNEPSDVKQCQPMMAATRHELDAVGIAAEIGTMLFDAGYCSKENLTAPGPDRLVANHRSRSSYAVRQKRRAFSLVTHHRALHHSSRWSTGYGLRRAWPFTRSASASPSPPSATRRRTSATGASSAEASRRAKPSGRSSAR